MLCTVRINNVTLMALSNTNLNDCPHQGRRAVTRVMRVVMYSVFLAIQLPATMAQPSSRQQALSTLQRALGSQRADFTNHQSEHFLLATDADSGTAKATLLELEDTYRHVKHWAGKLQLSTIAAHEAWPVVYFTHQKDFLISCERMGVSSEQGPGLYLPADHVAIFQDIANLEPWQAASDRIAKIKQAISVYSRPAGQVDDSQLQRMRDQLQLLQNKKKGIRKLFQRLVIRHEAAHMILNGLGILNTGASYPDWLTEGLAGQFELPFSKGETLGYNPMRMDDLKNALAADKSSAIIPLLTFVNENNFSASSAEESSWSYAQAWALVYFLQRNYPKAFTKYIACQAATTDSLENNLNTSCAGTTFLTDQSTFELNWLTWLRGLKLDH